MKSYYRLIVILTLSTMMPAAWGQRILSIGECREMAVKNNKKLEQERIKVEMAGYDRKIARANYYPNISGTGAYMFNEKDASLISDDMSGKLTHAGDLVQGSMNEFMGSLQQAIMSNPAAAAEYLQSPLWQTVMGAMGQTDISAALNQLGTELDNAFHLDINNIFIAGVSLQQPVFAGGKIVAANRIARIAEELAQASYDKEYQDVLTTVDQAYWQIVSIAAKKRLAENYSELLTRMQKDVEAAARAGMATKSDELAIKVKVNEANMMKTKATNGLVIAKMLLCKEIGMDLNSDIALADENAESVPAPGMRERKDIEEILADRPETRSLDLASKIYDQKVRVARADMMPQVALTAGYLFTNPSASNGFSNKWGGHFSVGVAVNVPIFHGMEATQKTRKAKAEAALYRSQYQDACEMITLQVSQLEKQMEEALEKLSMAESNLDNAEENVRMAASGVKNGAVTTNTALSAHSAWLQAQSEYIDAGIEAQMVNVNLMKAEGELR
ncbi:MAG: TolC family protein [Candidatus Cryptobacteroides sp.]